MTATRPGRLELAGELTVITATEQHQRLRSVLTGGVDCELGLAGVTDFDTAGLQVLLVARQEAERVGVRLTFREPSRAVRDVLAIAHLDAVFDTARPGTGLEP